MKSGSVGIKAHLATDCTTLATLLKIVRKDGTVFAFTDHDQALTFGGVDYLPQFGFSRTADTANSDMSPDNQDASLFIDEDTITERDLRGKLFDSADVEIRVVNWADLTQDEIKMRKGTTGELTIKRGEFTSAVRGLLNKLGVVIGETYGAPCRAQLGDAKCGIDITGYQQTGSVLSSADGYTLTPNSGLKLKTPIVNTDPAPDGWFDDGLLTFSSGVNNGLSYQVKTWDGTVLTFSNPMLAAPAAADTFIIEPGCDHDSAGDCNTKFSNIVNFRGEPFIPGMDQMADYPDAHTGDSSQ